MNPASQKCPGIQQHGADNDEDEDNDADDAKDEDGGADDDEDSWWKWSILSQAALLGRIPFESNQDEDEEYDKSEGIVHQQNFA